MLAAAQHLSTETQRVTRSLYLTGALPHVFHVRISHLGMYSWQGVIQLSRWIYPQEQD